MSDVETTETKPKRARRARKSKVREAKVSDHFFDEEEDSGNGEPAPKTFTAILQTSHTYQFAGYTFHNGVPEENLPMSLYEKIKSNGNFIIP